MIPLGLSGTASDFEMFTVLATRPYLISTISLEVYQSTLIESDA